MNRKFDGVPHKNYQALVVTKQLAKLHNKLLSTNNSSKFDETTSQYL
jgi:hypothetical protein